MVKQYVLIVKGVWKFFGGVVANEDVSLRAGEGEVVSVLGPNGAGKTTLLRQIYGELKPDRGVVQIAGLSPRKAKERGLVGAVPQEASPFHGLKVVEHVEMAARLRGVPKGRARECAREAIYAVGLGGRERDLVMSLSGGMRRLVLVASAMACRPKLILLDEPTAGVDVQNRRRIWEAVKAAKEAGSAVVLTTHYIHEAEELSDVVYLLNRRVLMRGAPAELKRLLPWVEVRTDDRVVRVEWDKAVEIVAELARRRARFELREPTLEDVLTAVWP
ncbi:ABC transporter ATP-binding protein [Pyrobaculum neutrophilum]|uniref:ABC transporter related n=1 Tax=Pyrobaculum neutrophilum (strain DSM 2338 / JCM 9278 / NBRC 100436 / V24Sta) TaxID=444157 RepID=B1YE17_PYRNV|nr:ABC transporter ATP-binding protein [Pyrobaculum neutrophilum]ACB40030.1 ABC transporter related [Pyrobaculum neutrophilum V24Sta]